MVSKASEDLPEPDRPVNTTSLSRGISRSTFLRLCSRAPRMVMARVPEPAFCWRFALITSSISAFQALESRSVQARSSAGQGRGIGRQWVNSEHRKNDARFPVPRSNHQRFVGSRRIFAQDPSRNGGSSQQRAEMPADWNANKKAGARPAFRFRDAQIRLASVLSEDRATKAVVQADEAHI